MGFADYLSRHPKQKPPPLSADDTQYIINLITDFKFFLTQNSINHILATRTISDKYQTDYLTANNSTHANNYDSASCLSPINLQSLTLSSSFKSKLNHSNSKQIPTNTNSHQYTSKMKPQGLPPNSNYINSIYSTSFANSKTFPQGYNTSQVTTRSRPKQNTFQQNITKRKRAPCKLNKKMNPTRNTIGTQTDGDNNKGLGRSALRWNPIDPIYL